MVLDEGPFLAVIVPTFNREEMLESCLKLLTQQSFTQFFVIVVDAAQSAAVQELCARSGIAEYLPVSSENFWTGSINAGIMAALQSQCTHVLLLNDDSWYSNNFLENLVQAALRGSDIVAPRVVLRETDTVFCDGGLFYQAGPHIYQCNRFLQNRPQLSEDVYTDGLLADSNCGNGVLFSRSTLEKNMPFDEKNCPQYHGDSEFTHRCVQNGATLRIYPSIEIQTEYSSHFKKMHDFGAAVRRDDASKSEFRKILNLFCRFYALKNDPKGLVYWPSLRTAVGFNSGILNSILAGISLYYLTFLAAATEGDEVFHFCRKRQVEAMRGKYSHISSRLFWLVSKVFEKYVLKNFDEQIIQ
ncbi:glycosyltransferase family 2 protein [Rhizobium sp.]|uniref:glycosyltransferase family 2 protein n=1 Tax=Rhizobium sp. TaxID=391 RepID=UPI0034C5FFFF